jgi:HEAT repeat protein
MSSRDCVSSWPPGLEAITMAETRTNRSFDIRSRLVEEVLAYLDEVARWAAALPRYFPAHLRDVGDSKTGFDAISQQFWVVEDRSRWHRGLAEKRERLRAARMDVLAIFTTESTPAEPGESSDRDGQEHSTRPIPWDRQAAERFKRAVILGDPGMGKSWFLKHEARRLALEAKHRIEQRSALPENVSLPIPVSLSDLNQSDGPLEKALVRLAGRHHSKTFRGLLREQLKSDLAVVLLDDWDEVPVERPDRGQPIAFRPRRQQRLGQRLENFAENQTYRKCRLLMTSRIVDYGGAPFPDAQELELIGFDEHRIEGFARAWLKDEEAGHFLGVLRGNSPMHELARTPRILSRMCRAYLAKKVDHRTCRADLYEHCLRGLLGDWKKRKNDPETMEDWIEYQINILSQAALVLFDNAREEFTETDLANALPGLAPGEDDDRMRKQKWINRWKRDGLLSRCGSDDDAKYLFLHHTFHEYLAARDLARNGWDTIHERMYRNSWQPAWQGVIVTLAGLLRDPAPLLELLVNKQPDLLFRYRWVLTFQAAGGYFTIKVSDDLFRHRLVLAARALAAVRDAHRLNGLAERIADEMIDSWHHLGTAWSGHLIEHIERAMRAIAIGNLKVGQSLSRKLAQVLAGDEDYVIHGKAFRALRGLGGAAVPGLTELLRHKSLQVRFAASEALGKLGSTAAPAADALIDRLRHVLDAEPMEFVAKQAPAGYTVDREEAESVHRYAASVIIKALGDIGPGAAPAVPFLIKLLGDDKCKQWWPAAALALGKLGLAALPSLVGLLHHEDRAVCCAAIEAVIAIGPAAASSLSSLVSLGRRADDYGVKRLAIKAILGLGPAAVPAASSLVNEFRREDRRALMDAISEFGMSGPVDVSIMVDFLRDEDEELCYLTLQALLRLGPPSAPPLSALIELIRAGRASLFYGVEMALQSLGPAAEPAVLELVALLPSESPAVRLGAVRALGALGPVGAQAIDPLIKLLRDGESDDRHAAAKALGRLGPAAEPAVPALIGVLRDTEGLMRSVAAQALENLGPTAKSAIPALLELALRADEIGHREALGALVKLGGHQALIKVLRYADRQVRSSILLQCRNPSPDFYPGTAALIERLGDEFDDVRGFAAWALEGYYPNATPAIPVLRELLRCEREKERATPPEVKSELDPRAAHVINALIDLLHHEDTRMREAAADFIKDCAYGDRGMVARLAVPALIERLRDTGSVVRSEAVEILGQMGSDVAAAAPVLVELLRSKEGSTRSEAAKALGRLGPAAEPAVPTLIGLLRDPENVVRSDAAKVLGGLGRAADPAVDLLVELFHCDKDNNVRHVAAGALRRLGRATAAGALVLSELLGHQDKSIFDFFRSSRHEDLARLMAEGLRIFPVESGGRVDFVVKTVGALSGDRVEPGIGIRINVHKCT